jgi:mono/diheme cytochrome c family protein
VIDEETLSSLITFMRLLSPGYELYERFCTRCHGSDGYPPAEAPGEMIGVPRLSRDELIGVVFDEEYFRSRPEAYIRAWVEFMYKSDHSSMPKFINQLGVDEVRKILAYLREVDTKR